jgi:hypothetical protein
MLRRMRGLAPRHGHWRLVVLLVVLAGVLAAPGIAQAAHSRVLERRTLAPATGGLLRHGGVSLYVPPGVMTRRGTASIVQVGRRVYDIHISVPWHGTVAVSLPLHGHGDTIVHRLTPGVWVSEGTARGARTVWVSQLSWFSNATNKVAGALCIKFDITGFLECLARKGVKYVDGKIMSWIESKLPNPCAASLVSTAYAGKSAGPGDILATVWAAINPNGECVRHAGETAIRCPDGSYHVLCPTPPPAQPPTQQPPPAPQSPSQQLPTPRPPTRPPPTQPPPTQPPPTQQPPTQQPPTQQPPPPPQPSISAAKGGYYKGGYTLDIAVHNFPTGTFVYECHDNSGPGGRDTVYFSHAVTVTDPNQSVWPGVFCYDTAPYVAYLVMAGYRSNNVQY